VAFPRFELSGDESSHLQRPVFSHFTWCLHFVVSSMMLCVLDHGHKLHICGALLILIREKWILFQQSSESPLPHFHRRSIDHASDFEINAAALPMLRS